MKLADCRIGFAITGSFCTFAKVKEELKKLEATGADITPVFSFNTQITDSRFAVAHEYVKEIEQIVKKEGMKTIAQAEPVGPKALFDIMVIAPCTGNTLAKLAYGIIDTPVTMAAKSHLRNARPLIIAPSTNDGLSGSAKNIGALLNYKNVYVVPFAQDDSAAKPRSLVSDFEQIQKSLEKAFNGVQFQAILA